MFVECFIIYFYVVDGLYLGCMLCCYRCVVIIVCFVFFVVCSFFMFKYIVFVVVVVVVGLFFFVCVDVCGVGLIVVVLVYCVWLEGYVVLLGVMFSYDVVGLGEGLKCICVGVVDFGVFDVLFFSVEVVKVGFVCVLLVVMGVVLFVNVLGVLCG